MAATGGRHGHQNGGDHQDSGPRSGLSLMRVHDLVPRKVTLGGVIWGSTTHVVRGRVTVYMNTLCVCNLDGSATQESLACYNILKIYGFVCLDPAVACQLPLQSLSDGLHSRPSLAYGFAFPPVRVRARSWRQWPF